MAKTHLLHLRGEYFSKDVPRIIAVLSKEGPDISKAETQDFNEPLH